MPDAVLCEMEDVIIETRPLRRRAMQRAAGEIGLELSDRDFDAHCGGFTPEVGARAVLALHGRPTDAVSIELLAARATHAFAALLGAGMALAPGAASTLSELAETMLIAIVTRATRREATMLLDLASLDTLFTCVIAAEDAPEPKPSPALHRAALTRIGRRHRLDRRRTVALEDGPAGIHAARAAGLRSVLVHGGREPVTLSADAVVRNLSDVSSTLFEALARRPEEPAA